MNESGTDTKGHPRFSVIIPVYREGIALRRCLDQLSHVRRIEEAEIIVVDGDEGTTVQSSRPSPLPFRLVVTPPGRGRQLNAGVRLARSPRLLFLHADTRLVPDALSLVERALSAFEAGAFDLRIESHNYWVKTVSLVGGIRSRISRIPYGDQVHFIRRKTLFRMGLFPDIPLMEDVALMTRLKHHGIPIKILKTSAYTSDRRYREDGVFRRTLGNWAILLAYRAGVPPWRLAKRYESRWRVTRKESA